MARASSTRASSPPEGPQLPVLRLGNADAGQGGIGRLGRCEKAEKARNRHRQAGVALELLGHITDLEVGRRLIRPSARTSPRRALSSVVLPEPFGRSG